MTTAAPGRAARLVAALLPATWPTRAAALDLAGRLDRAHGEDGAGVLLRGFAAWRTTGELPTDPLVRDLVALLATALGAPVEMRLSSRRLESSSSPGSSPGLVVRPSGAGPRSPVGRGVAAAGPASRRAGGARLCHRQGDARD